MQTYNAIAGQSIYDVCLQTYGSLDYLYKLMQDNGINGLNELVLSRQAFVWDDNLVVDQQLNVAFAASATKYSTDVSNYGSVYYVINNGGAVVPNNPNDPYVPPTTSSQYQMVYNTTYTSTQDGLTVITPTAIGGGSLAGFDILQVELEIKPLIPEGQVGAQYIWNKAQGILTLTNGTTCDAGVTLFILFSKIVTA